VHGGQPVSNSDYWQAKMAHNKRRDEWVNAALMSGGWHVRRVWEHIDVITAANLIVSELKALSSIDGQ